MIQIFRNLQVVKRQQVEEFVRRLIFPISQAAVAVSEKSSSYINYFSKFYLRGSLGDCSIQVNNNTDWDSVKSDRDCLLEADIAVIDGKQIREFNTDRLIQGDSFIRCRLIEVQMYIHYVGSYMTIT